MKVKIRGTLYNSVREASDALGFSKSQIHYALNKGKLDQLGLPREPHIYRESCLAIDVCGHHFISYADLGRYLGRGRGSILRTINAGGSPWAKLEGEVLRRKFYEQKGKEND